jgi:hypothetical protein
MTPIEKAKELFERFNIYSSNNIPDYEKYFNTESAIRISKYSAKKCALIAVDEILEECRLERDWYWEKVKQEIEKL